MAGNASEAIPDFQSLMLVDGHRLTALMIRYEVGCRVEETLAIKRLDEEFFGA